MEMLRKHLEIKAGDVQGRSVRVTASTESEDSYGDIVTQDWDLRRYERNPVVLYNHNSFGGMFGGARAEETLPIGSASDVRVVGGALEATLNFVTAEANPLAEKILQLFKQRAIRAVSVGFRPGAKREETRNGRDVYVLSKNELYEISVTPMGANADAVAKSLHASNIAALKAPPVTGASARLAARAHESAFGETQRKQREFLREVMGR